MFQKYFLFFRAVKGDEFGRIYDNLFPDPEKSRLKQELGSKLISI